MIKNLEKLKEQYKVNLTNMDKDAVILFIQEMQEFTRQEIQKIDSLPLGGKNCNHTDVYINNNNAEENFNMIMSDVDYNGAYIDLKIQIEDIYLMDSWDEIEGEIEDYELEDIIDPMIIVCEFIPNMQIKEFIYG